MSRAFLLTSNHPDSTLYRSLARLPSQLLRHGWLGVILTIVRLKKLIETSRELFQKAGLLAASYRELEQIA